VLALVITREGLPIYHEVLPGSTADVTRLRPTVELLKSRFRIKRCILVCDGGLVSEENLSFLDEAGIPYIVAIRRRGTHESDELIQKSLRGFVEVKELGFYVKEKVKGDIRYILCHNVEETREALLAKAQSEIDKLNRRFLKGGLGREQLYHRGFKILERYRLEKYFCPKVEKVGLILYINTDYLDRERFLEGKFFLKTKLASDELSTEEVIRTYKALQQIERAFRELKDFLKIRPIFHWTDRRVKAHVMICVLAYLLEKMVEIYCHRANLKLSPRRALSILAQLKAIQCNIGDQSLLITTAIQQRIKEILNATDVPIPEKIIENQLLG
jgi:transposase